MNSTEYDVFARLSRICINTNDYDSLLFFIYCRKSITFKNSLV